MKPTVKERWNNFKNSRRFRYGSIAMLLTCVVVALVIVLNVVFGALANHFMWYADMTEEDLYGVGEASLSAVAASGARYEILFCAQDDIVEQSASGLGAYVLECAKNYEAAGNVTVRFLDPNNPDTTDPDSVAYYSVDDGRTKPSQNSVIVAAYAADAPAASRPISYRILSMYSFFASDSETNEIFAFDGEYKFTVTMLGLAGEKPTVYFTDGHGENNGEDSMLYQLFEDAGYTVRVIDLGLEALPADVAAGDIVLVINNPQKDFGGYRSPRPDANGNETEKLEAFLTGGGNLLLFADAVTYNLPNLLDVMAVRGIGFETAGYVTDTANSLSGNAAGQTLIASYPTNENNAASPLISSISALRTITPNATALKYVGNALAGIIEGSDDHQIKAGTAYTTWSPVLQSSANAKVGDTVGTYNLMLMGTTPRHEAGVPDSATEAEKASLMLVCGAPQAVSNEWLSRTDSANRDLMYSVLLTIASNGGSLELMPSEISMKTLSSEVLNISTRQANVWTAICVSILPVIAIVCGTVVYVRRKHL